LDRLLGGVIGVTMQFAGALAAEHHNAGPEQRRGKVWSFDGGIGFLFDYGRGR
jgi:hypothetical protein